MTPGNGHVRRFGASGANPHRAGAATTNVAPYPGAVAESVVEVRVLRRSGRTDQLLVSLARELGLDEVEPDEYGKLRLALAARGPAAWQTVRDALDAAGPDWRQWLYLEPRPPR